MKVGILICRAWLDRDNDGLQLGSKSPLDSTIKTSLVPWNEDRNIAQKMGLTWADEVFSLIERAL